jgi:hypothetical protein
VAPPQGPATITAASTARSAFEQTMATHFGVARFDYGGWDPGDPADIYGSIVAAFADFAAALGGTPSVKEIDFQDGGAGASGEAADYSAGTMTVYRRITSATWWLPLDRSNPQGAYPPSPGGTVGVPGGAGGAPIPLPTVAASQQRIIVHELGHAVVEGMMTPRGQPLTALDPNLIKDFARAAGWFGGTLYDIGDPAVQQALNATPPQQPSAQPIAAGNWNDPKWVEQPVGNYQLAGPHEDFPQSLMAYVYAPALLKKRSPSRYTFLDARKATWKPILTGGRNGLGP